MKRSNIARVVVVCAVALMLAGCGDPSIEERVAYREKCEAADGHYREYRSGWDSSLKMRCDLTRQEVKR